MQISKSGFIVQTADGRIGRTYHGKELVKGKVPVYLALNFTEIINYKSIATKFSETATLFAAETLTQIGYID